PPSVSEPEALETDHQDSLALIGSLALLGTDPIKQLEDSSCQNRTTWKPTKLSPVAGLKRSGIRAAPRPSRKCSPRTAWLMDSQMTRPIRYAVPKSFCRSTQNSARLFPAST